MNKTTRLVASIFGAYVGIVGIEHGLGEITQGNILVPTGTRFMAWPNSPLFRILGGEPAMTFIPNLLLSGILAIAVSLVIVAWSLGFVQRKFGSPILILFCILQLLVGGGYAPPTLGLITALGALMIHMPVKWLNAHLPLFIRRGASRLWPWIFGICLLIWFYLFPGSIILAFLFGLADSQLIIPFSFPAIGFLILTFVVAFGNDIDRYHRVELA